MLEFLARLFGRMETGTSRESARNRLRLVLVHDRAAISPGLMEQLRSDLIEVIGRYMEIDEGNMRVEFDRSDSSVAIVASIPVREVKREAAPAR
ncbi:MAG: cell division topological specificity factor MinE [Firmicutes bacterium]|jgi:cell division topological specificity factor|nr:cell division topological specificity factor MinE [Bacillota bacterium]